ncbi:MAG: class I SAM-dependent methyltransferase [Mesorhizobium sp.]|nr:class I SAM-dependent methyltransferase [Mesorhizobium sp.]MBL8576605.1 class I SAM-dependent methyltransferase [Mesorhizobium sp.]
MRGKGHSKALDGVYAAASPDELARAYADWSASYDHDTLSLGYALPFVVTSWLARHVPKGDGPILDAGCGTGLSGGYAKALGYDRLEGLDFSPDMLAVAAGRGAYAKLTEAELGKALPWPDGHFAAFFSTGVFTEGHAPASALDELVRITRPGGYAVLTVRDTVLVSQGFRAKFTELEKEDRWETVDESPLFRAFTIAEPEVLVQAFVFRVL